MQYEAKTPEAYLALLEDDWRRKTLHELRTLILSQSPDLVEEISYKMLSYRDERGPLLALNAQKHYVSLYVGDAKKIDPDGSLLQGLDCGKGCIRFKKSTSVAETNIATFIARTIALWKQGEDIDCAPTSDGHYTSPGSA